MSLNDKLPHQLNRNLTAKLPNDHLDDFGGMAAESNETFAPEQDTVIPSLSQSYQLAISW